MTSYYYRFSVDKNTSKIELTSTGTSGSISSALLALLIINLYTCTSARDDLRSVLSFCGLDTARYKSHSFRIGAAFDAALRGFSDAQIRLMVRWRSDAFRQNIRLPH